MTNVKTAAHISNTIDERDLSKSKIVLADPKSATRMVRYSTVMIDKSAPGERTHEFSLGAANLETRALILTSIEDEMIRILLDAECNRVILSKLFPTKVGGYLDTRNPHFTLTGLQDFIKKTVATYVPAGKLEYASLFYADMISHMLHGTAVVQASKPYVFTTTALNVFADGFVIEEQSKLNSLMDTLDSINLALNMGKIHKLTPKYFTTHANRVMMDLGNKLLENKKHSIFFRDAQTLVKYYHNPKQKEEFLPIGFRDNLHLKALAENLTFTMAANSTSEANVVVSPPHEYKDVVAYVDAVLKKSPRLEIVPLVDAKKYFSHMQVKDPKDQVVGSVMWRNLNGHVRTQATRFIPLNVHETLFFQHPQPIVEEAFNGIGSALFKRFDSAKIGRLAHEILSNIAHKETEPYCIIIGASNFDMIHYAIAMATAVYFRHDLEKDFKSGFIYEVHHNDHYLGSVGTYGEKSLLTSPDEVITLTEDNMPNVEVAPRIQGIREESRNGFLWEDPKIKTIALDKTMKYRTSVKNKKVTLDVSIQDLIGLYEDEEIRIHVPVVNRVLVKMYYDTVMFLKRKVKSADNEDKELNKAALYLTIAMHFNSILSLVYTSATGKSLAQAIIFKLLQALSVDDLKPYKLDLYRAEKQIDMLVWTSLVVLMKMGYLTYAEVTDLRNIITEPGMIQYLLASTDFDFREV